MGRKINTKSRNFIQELQLRMKQRYIPQNTYSEQDLKYLALTDTDNDKNDNVSIIKPVAPMPYKPSRGTRYAKPANKINADKFEQEYIEFINKLKANSKENNTETTSETTSETTTSVAEPENIVEINEIPVQTNTEIITDTIELPKNIIIEENEPKKVRRSKKTMIKPAIETLEEPVAEIVDTIENNIIA